MLEASDIRFCKSKQLAAILNCDEAEISRLNKGKKDLSDSMQNYAVSLGVPLNSLVKGIKLRRKDHRAALRHQSRVDEFLQSVGQK